jgi:hypothetical protein
LLLYIQVYINYLIILWNVLRWFYFILPKELLPVHASYMQREETSAKVIQGHEHSRHDLWRSSWSSMWETDGNPNSSSQTDAIPC